MPNANAAAAETRRTTAKTSRARATGGAYQHSAPADYRSAVMITAPPIAVVTSRSSAPTTVVVSRRPVVGRYLPRTVATTPAAVTTATAQPSATACDTSARPGARTRH